MQTSLRWHNRAMHIVNRAVKTCNGDENVFSTKQFTEAYTWCSCGTFAAKYLSLLSKHFSLLSYSSNSKYINDFDSVRWGLFPLTKGRTISWIYVRICAAVEVKFYSVNLISSTSVIITLRKFVYEFVFHFVLCNAAADEKNIVWWLILNHEPNNVTLRKSDWYERGKCVVNR